MSLFQPNKRSVYLLLLIIVLLGGLLRFYRLGQVPSGFHRDEAFLSYNAYSILTTGREISGDFFPVNFRSFMYSPGGYAYSSIPWIFLLGLNPFSSRFSSALFGTLTVVLTYFFVVELFSYGSRVTGRGLRADPRTLAVLSSLLLAISPWHINLSRTVTDNVLVVFFVTLGVWLYLVWSRLGHIKFLLASFASLALTLGIYQAPRAFVPIFIPFLIFLFRPAKEPKSVMLPLVLLVGAVILPVYLILKSPDLSLRLSTVSILATAENQLVVDEQIREDGVLKISIPQARMFHNKVRAYGEQFLKNYFSHFSYDFLFTDKGLPDRYRVPGAGLLYLIELPFLLLGIHALLASGDRKQKILLPWLVLGFVGSSLAFDDVPNLQRTVLVFPTIPILTALGILFAISALPAKRLTIRVFSFFAAIGFAYFFASYMHAYYSHQLIHRPWFRQEGYAKLVAAVNQRLSGYDGAIVTNRETAPAIFFLFYGSYNPSIFQKEMSGRTVKDYDRVNFGPYEFSEEECPFQEKGLSTGARVLARPIKPRTLYVNWGNCAAPTTFGNVLETIYRGDGTPVYTIVAAKEGTL